ncbi:hypothetical protein F4808DRAFT_449627 [Astrocystis sublimbata]|nr:hypothetical protein F4808DRAFT_449627 [Astrocystis sublimbata]
MAQPSSVLSQTMQSISLTKIRELEKQRDRYETRKNAVLAAADKHPSDVRARINELLRGVKTICDPDLAKDKRVENISTWLQQSTYDASLPFHMLQSYEALLRSKLEVQSRKLGIGHLWSRLVTEWMNSTTPMDETPASNDEVNEAERQEKRLKELCEKFEHVVFEPLETDEARIEQYLESLFSGEEAQKSLGYLRSSIKSQDEILLSKKEPFDYAELEWCINGLLAEDLLSDEKQAVLRKFRDSPVVLEEIANILNMRFADFDNWTWDAGVEGIPVLPRQQLNGKYRIWMDEDVLQAIFIHYVGIKHCVHLKSVLTQSLDQQAWDWQAGKSMTDDERLRFEYFTAARLNPDPGLGNLRAGQFRDSFFLSQLPTSETTIGKSSSYVNDGHVEEEYVRNRRNGKETKHVNVKQKLLRTLATEAIIHRKLYGEAAVIQSDLQWYATGLSHTTIFAVMRFLGYSERMISFYRKVLEAPLNMVSNPGELPTGEARIRRRGVPMAHAPEKFTGEMILFIMDFAVNKATGMLLYRLHDDLFLCGEPRRCVQAWKEMETVADVMGVEFNKYKTGSVYLTDGGISRDPEVEAALPEGVVRIGHLGLDRDSGDWLLDQDQIGEHLAQLRKQLAACNNILDWVKTWNSCISRFFSHTLGEPAYCFGLKHVDSVLETYQHFQMELFGSADLPQDDRSQATARGSVVDYLKSKIAAQFGVSDVPDAFIFLPETLGVEREKESYDAHRKALSKLQTREERLSRLGVLYAKTRFEHARSVLEDVLTPGEEGDFMEFEEYKRHRESTSHLLKSAYETLLVVPKQKGVKLEGFVTDAIREAGLQGSERSKVLQIEWVLQLYQDELEERWGGSRLVHEKYLPLGLLAMMRRKAVRWTMQGCSIPVTSEMALANPLLVPSAPPPSTNNPLKLIPPAYRSILTTLHVLYPTTLLPALDLLDRRLVTRKPQAEDNGIPSAEEMNEMNDISNPQDPNNPQDIRNPQAAKQSQAEAKAEPLYHLVRSAQPQSHRHRDQPYSGGRVYAVRLPSWNCTCAAFAFAAFPPLPSRNSLRNASSPDESEYVISDYHDEEIKTRDEDEVMGNDMDTDMNTKANTTDKWEFGGLSTDGKDGSTGVPCCKHLLACVLAERWSAVLGGYMEERLVSREEAAGLVGDL